jgi:ABC-type Zn2+ transport system substrate-binding protein/surface adhesin
VSEHDQHHQHHKEEHDKAREEKKERLQHGHPEGKAGPMFYPKLFVVIGIVLTLAVIIIWTMV